MEVVFYQTQSGNCPVEGHFNKWNIKRRSKADAILKAMKTGGGRAGSFSKPLTRYDYHEITVHAGEKEVRILYFIFENRLIVLLNAFEKPSLYEKAKKRKVNAIINKIYNETQSYYIDFLNKNKYKLYKVL